jgi:phosphoglycolate phosphatase
LGNALIKAVIFDFDGTLVDSEVAIYECFQRITKHLVPERESYAKKILIGPPLRDTASEILGPNHQGKLDEFVKLFIEMHDERAIKNTRPYSDVIETLQKLSSKGISMAVATNKRQEPTKKLVEYFGWENYFKFIECSDSKSKIRDKNLMIKEILTIDDDFSKALFIGDTVNDGLSANINNLNFIKANYGYGGNQDWSDVKILKEIDNIYEILNF